jgi:hypothetical protein
MFFPSQVHIFFLGRIANFCSVMSLIWENCDTGNTQCENSKRVILCPQPNTRGQLTPCPVPVSKRWGKENGTGRGTGTDYIHDTADNLTCTWLGFSDIHDSFLTCHRPISTPNAFSHKGPRDWTHKTLSLRFCFLKDNEHSDCPPPHTSAFFIIEYELKECGHQSSTSNQEKLENFLHAEWWTPPHGPTPTCQFWKDSTGSFSLRPSTLVA